MLRRHTLPPSVASRLPHDLVLLLCITIAKDFIQLLKCLALRFRNEEICPDAAHETKGGEEDIGAETGLFDLIAQLAWSYSKEA